MPKTITFGLNVSLVFCEKKESRDEDFYLPKDKEGFQEIILTHHGETFGRIAVNEKGYAVVQYHKTNAPKILGYDNP